MNPDQFDPADALALAGRAQRRTVQRGLTWWFYPVAGLSIGGMSASLALPSPVVGIVVSLMISVVNLVVWRDRTGLGWIRHTPRTLRVAIPVVVLLMGGFLLTFELWHRFGVEWAPLAAAPILAVAGALGSWLIDRTWAADQDAA